MTGNLFADLPGSLPAELTETLARSGAVRVERIVSTGHSSSAGYWYDQPEWEFVVVLTGSATLTYEGGTVLDLGPGDWVEIAPHVRHRVERTASGEPTVWLAVFAPAE